MSVTKRLSRRGLAIGAATAAVAAVALALLVGRSRATSQPNILVVVIDSLRFDRVGAMGSPQDLTPFIDDVAAKSVIYRRAYAPSSWTAPVVASLFTGQYPSENGVTDFFVSLKDGATTLASVLATHGYMTSGVTANAVIQDVIGFSQGFQRYKLVGEPTYENPKSDGKLVNDQALKWVDEVGRDKPHFVYLHYMDVHLPYRTHHGITPPRSPAVERSDEELINAVMWDRWEFSPEEVWRIEDMYNGEVQYMDGVLRDLFAGLEQRGFLKNALVVVTADHGEQFGHHGVFGHGASLNEAVIHVPLSVHMPDNSLGFVPEPVELGGLAAFILDTVGVDTPPTMRIKELPTVDDTQRATHPAPVRSELVQWVQKDHWQHKQALVLGTHKLLVTPDGREVMYDLSRDPYERRPLPSVDATLHDALEVELAALQKRIEGDSAPQQVTPDAATLERLRAAGYLQDH